MRLSSLVLVLCLALPACDGEGDGAEGAPAGEPRSVLEATGPVILLPQANLIPSAARALATLKITNEFFYPDHCALVEQCVGGPGYRKLLRFDTLARNAGTRDLRLGVPSDDNPAFEYSSCHDHYHWTGFSVYQLIGPDGVVASGRKQAFCLEDTTPPAGGDPDDAHYTCDDQGITAGWGDTYRRHLDCQWIDITDVAPGQYTLRITLNPERILPESRYDDNVANVAVTIP